MFGPESASTWLNKHDVQEESLLIVHHRAASWLTRFAEWKVVFGIVQPQHRVVVSGHPCLRRRTLIQRTVLGFPVQNTNMKIKGYFKLAPEPTVSGFFFPFLDPQP